MGVGFGVTGGIKAAVSAGFSNTTSGMAQGALGIYRAKLLGDMNSAKTRYQNLQKANVSNEAHLEAIAECIGEFPFEAQYWKDYFLFAVYMGVVNRLV